MRCIHWIGVFLFLLGSGYANNNEKTLREDAISASKEYGGDLGVPRNYYAEVTDEEGKNIRFIVVSLANKSPLAIAVVAGDLKAAGDQIDHVHPLRFLMTVFTDEELKVAMRKLRVKGWGIWGQFSSPLKRTLKTEANKDNMKEAYVVHFAKTVEIDVNRIYPSILKHDWDGLIDILINEIPRKGDYDRYDN